MLSGILKYCWSEQKRTYCTLQKNRKRLECFWFTDFVYGVVFVSAMLTGIACQAAALCVFDLNSHDNVSRIFKLNKRGWNYRQQKKTETSTAKRIKCICQSRHEAVVEWKAKYTFGYHAPVHDPGRRGVYERFCKRWWRSHYRNRIRLYKKERGLMTNPHSTEDNHTGRRIIKNVDLSHLSFINLWYTESKRCIPL